ncbi:hypothetical protein Rhe02_87010 [Rhizocola hellebori]|uniref:PPE family domain-containing protein n=1 Tax=Rhizocola hellebori TaxID=1392758 RepID=A0A8J3QGH1_9ACTN|nr:WXG100 family type VII secretion target [Rhizocola hellebori]GIH10634.1 hypothetical protein Rhe02_87010 [Rhizocola hellebori]
MAQSYRAVKPPWPEGEPSWAQVVNRVIVRGRPNYLRHAADIYDDVFTQLHSAANNIDSDLEWLSQHWSGPAFDNYQRSVAGIATELRRIIEEANAYGGISNALRQAADRLYAYQQVIPIPRDCAADVVRAHHEGLELTDHRIEEALRKEAEDSGFFSFFFDFLDWLSDVINDHTGTARDQYRSLSSDYANAAASAPDSVEPPRVITPSGYTPNNTTGDIGGGGGYYRPPSGLGDPTHLNPDDLNGLGDGPGFGDLSGTGTGGSLAGAGGGSLAGSAGGVGLGAGGAKFSDTGAAFGTPVNLAGALPPGVGGMGGGMGMPMGAGAGAGGAGGEDGYSTWLTDDSDSWNRARDGQSAPPVLE